MRKFKLSTAKNKLKKLWSEFIRHKYPICQLCGIKPTTEAHHIVPKGVCRNAGQFEAENGMGVCFRCHKNMIPTDPDTYIRLRDAWLAQKGLNYQELRSKYQKSVKLTEEFYLQKLGKLS